MILEIPDDYFVDKVDLDCEEPYCLIIPEANIFDKPVKLLVPKPLAYYLTNHFCGSWKMMRVIEDNIKREISKGIKKSLMLEE